jgi:hypothetical protein
LSGLVIDLKYASFIALVRDRHSDFWVYTVRSL